MSAAVFADTHYFFALLDPRDASHRKALAESNVRDRTFLTTEFILLELGDGFCAAEDRAEFIALLGGLRADPRVKVVPVSPDLLGRAIDLYRERPDKNWSLTDCTSFIVMHDHVVADALTGDHHFTQAGFRALLA